MVGAAGREGQRADGHDDAAAGEAGERAGEAPRPLEGEEVVCGLRIARDRLWCELGAEGDHDRIPGQLTGIGRHPPRDRVQLANMAPHDLDPRPEHLRQRARDGGRPALPDHQPQQRRREDLVRVAIDDDDLVSLAQALAEGIRRGGATDATTQDQHCRHGRLLSNTRCRLVS